jgi:signal transduction histidine kinase
VRITTKLVSASGFLAILLLGVLIYALSVVGRLTTMHENLSAFEFPSATIVIEQGRLLAHIDQLTQKLFVTRDPGYADKIQEIRTSFDGLLADLEELQVSAAERQEIDSLASLWRDFPLQALTDQVLAAPAGSEEEALLLETFRERSSALGQQARAVAEANRVTVTETLDRSLEASQHAKTLSSIIVLSALFLSVPVLWLTISSISKPLKTLSEGARSVARGEFAYRVEDPREDEFSSLASSFNEMVRSLDLRERRGRDLLSHLSHELKTPLVAMQETNRLLLDGLPGPLNSKQTRLLHLNLESGERLAAMITKLLDLARLEEKAVPYDFQAHDLVAIARTTGEAFSARAMELGISLMLDAPTRPVFALCDRDHILQALGNLVENALKFSPSESTVTLRVRPGALAAPTSRSAREGAEDPSPTALVQVIDEGPGIPREQRALIFERFHQIEGNSGDGVGLGLAICREIVVAHKGEIQVVDNPERGSTFSLTLPAPTTPVLQAAT